LLIDKVVGVKVALAENLGSSPSEEELARLVNDVYAGGQLRGRGGILHIHLGLHADPYSLVQSVIDRSGVPPSAILLCHVNYSETLFEGARRFSQYQTYLAVDSTLDPALEREGSIEPARAVIDLLESGASIDRLILQSDANGYRTAALNSLPATLRVLVKEKGFPIEKALRLVTTNPARVLGLSNTKGILAPGADADIVLLDGDFRPRHVFSEGKQRIPEGRNPQQS
jgi:beta-aspartyl-dipeptidase (metallo-type)